MSIQPLQSSIEPTEEERRRLAAETRRVYQKQHERFGDDATFDRFVRMSADPGYYHLTAADFAGKTLLDAGCGNTGYLEVAFHRFGVARIDCLDIGDGWIPSLKEVLRRRGVPAEKVRFFPGTTDVLPFADASYDFVASNGVLLHLNDSAQAERAFGELARVTKPGGWLYVQLGTAGGLVERIFPAIRDYYRDSPEFRAFVDEVSPASFRELFQTISDGMRRHTGEAVDLSGFAALFDEDFCTTIQNVVQVPKRHTIAMDEAWTRRLYAACGFDEPRRCRRYVERHNIRKYSAPLHYDLDNRYARMLYGPGCMEFIAKKRG